MKRRHHNLRHVIEYVPITSITPDPTSPRHHKKAQIKLLARSMDEFGFNVPLIVDEDSMLIAGHARLEAALLQGMDVVPIVKLAHLTLKQRQAFMVADNRLHDLSHWDKDKIAAIMLDLVDSNLDFEIELTGFSVGEIDLMHVVEDPSDLDDHEVIEGPAMAKLGDHFRLGRHALVCGSALDMKVYRTLLENEEADLVVTDPPYNVSIPGHVSGLGKVVHRQFAQGFGELSRDEFTEFLGTAMHHSAAVARGGSLHYWAMDWRHLMELMMAASGVYDEQVNLCVWAKTNAGMGSFYRSQHELFGVWRKGKASHRNNVQLGRFGRSRTNVWTYPGANSAGHSGDEQNLLALHPTVKPLVLITDILLDSTKRDDLVLDPFLGSGTTIIAAEKLGRRARGIELDPLYVDTVIRRWQRWTGEKAVRSDGVLFDDLDAEAELQD